MPGLAFQLEGAYYPDEVSSVLGDVDSVVIPSQLPETFSFSSLEALLRGVPVIVSRAGAHSENVVNGENGFTFDGQNAGELARILRRLATEDALLSHLRIGAGRFRFLTVPEHARAVVEVYKDAIEENRASTRVNEADLSETDFLEAALVRVGFAAATAVGR